MLVVNRLHGRIRRSGQWRLCLALGYELGTVLAELFVPEENALPGDEQRPPGSRRRRISIDRPWREVRRQLLEEAERRYLIEILKATRGRIGDAAKRAGMDPRSLHEKMRKHGLRKESYRS